MHEIFFTSDNLSKEAVLSYLLPIFMSCWLFGVPFCLEDTSHYLYIDLISITHRVTSLMKPHYSIFTFDKIRFKVFWSSFCGMPLYFWKLFSIRNICTKRHKIISYKFLRRCFLYYCLSYRTKKNSTALISLLGALRNAFRPLLDIFFNFLRNLKHSFDTLHECLNKTIVVTKLRNVFDFRLRWKFLTGFGPFYAIPVLRRGPIKTHYCLSVSLPTFFSEMVY